MTSLKINIFLADAEVHWSAKHKYNLFDMVDVSCHQHKDQSDKW